MDSRIVPLFRMVMHYRSACGVDYRI